MNPRRLVVLGICTIAALSTWLLAPASQATGPGPAITQLTDDHAIDVRPAWSPDNRAIAYQSNRDGAFHIYLMNADGTHQRALTRGASDDRHPLWTPDGKSILFDSSNGVGREIWSVNAADGSLKQLTRTGAVANFPAPSPDGQWMTFFVFKDGTLDLWLARLEGSEARPLTRELASDKNNQCTFACHQAAWSRDGQMLAYSGGDHETIWTMRRDGTDPKRVISDDEHNHFPWFMPDGRLGFITEHVSAGAAWTDAWAFDLQSGKRMLLLEDMSLQGPMDWNNDYTKVLFHSPRGGNFDIYMVDLSAPGGLDALQGKPLPADQVSRPIAPGAAEATRAASAPDGIANGLIGIAVGGILGLSAAGFVIWIFRRGHLRDN